MRGYLIVLGVALGTTLLLTPLVRLLAVRIGAVVRPDERRVHERPTPTLGGTAMYLGFLAAMATATRIPQFDGVFDSTSEPLGVVLGATVIFVVGLVDDLREVSAPAKVAGQVLAGGVLSLLGVTMLFFRIPFGDIVLLSPELAPLVTVLWVVGMANAINLIDGLDGLAAGIVAIAAAAFFLYSNRLFDEGFLPDNSVSPLIAIIVLGLCLGFLPHNVHPARIFMGDGGAMLLGLLMATPTLLVGGQTSEGFSGQTFFFFAPLFIPFFILGVPILDTAFAIVRRASRRTGVATADKDHLHHRLMRLGHGQRRSVLILWVWTALLSGFVLYPAYTDQGNAVVPFGVAALGIALYTLFHPEARRVRARGAEQLALGLDPEPEPEEPLAPPATRSASGTGRRH
ncbi:MAG: undecaprenyl/decaprenyl-phosphate alpha-N-acetylglucosaminyl 1-phosphate transferase [Actinomycetota bacterium]|nr:undecaprenyl/decaprenyl-phosphate alpha-N-acetylglucosaminyl 1-phosphate transferase [Actinomycetota bacterium]